jgi:hypothetical protein
MVVILSTLQRLIAALALHTARGCTAPIQSIHIE